MYSTGSDYSKRVFTQISGRSEVYNILASHFASYNRMLKCKQSLAYRLTAAKMLGCIQVVIVVVCSHFIVYV